GGHPAEAGQAVDSHDGQEHLVEKRGLKNSPDLIHSQFRRLTVTNPFSGLPCIATSRRLAPIRSSSHFGLTVTKLGRVRPTYTSIATQATHDGDCVVRICT